MSDYPKRKTKKKKKKKLTPLDIIARIGIVFGTTLVMILIFILAVCFVLIKGPSTSARNLFTLSANETSAMKWLPKLYMSDKEFDEILNPVKEDDVYTELPMAQITLSSDTNESIVVDESLPDIEIIDLKASTYQGKLMIVRDPSRVFFGSIDKFGNVGITLSDFLKKYDAIACTNAGGFADEGGKGKGGIPDGIVIRDGKIVYGSEDGTYGGLVGFDANHILHVGRMTGRQALNEGIMNGTSFSNGPVLIKDGVRQSNFVSGINPRTCIGQTAEGAVLLCVVEGRMADSLGATYENLADIMEQYGAINAINMDGGSSSGLYYEGERLTRSSSVIGDRPLPTAIIVSR